MLDSMNGANEVVEDRNPFVFGPPGTIFGILGVKFVLQMILTGHFREAEEKKQRLKNLVAGIDVNNDYHKKIWRPGK